MGSYLFPDAIAFFFCQKAGTRELEFCRLKFLSELRPLQFFMVLSSVSFIGRAMAISSVIWFLTCIAKLVSDDNSYIRTIMR